MKKKTMKKTFPERVNAALGRLYKKYPGSFLIIDWKTLKLIRHVTGDYMMDALPKVRKSPESTIPVLCHPLP